LDIGQTDLGPHDVEGLERIRFTTSHPNDMTDELIEAHGNCPKLMPYLHLPVQSGSDKILKRMNRSHTTESYLDVVARLRAARPDILLSGDFIVGFPEETEEDFQATLDLIKAVEYGQAYSFKYSTRPGTPAAERPQLQEEVKSERLQRLQALLSEQQKNIQLSMVGREVKVLLEKPGRLEGQMVGKSQYLHAVHVTGSGGNIGDIVRARVLNSEKNSLGGACVE
jgi:tRNA-2-methylthio-N6-dimethylallyladenosine synthase